MSHTNLVTINSTEINNSGQFRVGDDLSSGTAGQVLKSQGEDLAPEWGSDTDTTYIGSSTINIDTTTTPDTINCLKVPNALTAGTNISFSSGTTYDGSSALTISATNTDTTYTGTDPIDISGSNVISVAYDDDTIILDGGELAVDHVPNTLTFTGYDTGTFDGSTALSINLVDTNTTYTGGSNISVNTATTPNKIDLDSSITFMRGITYDSGFFDTTLTGNDYPSKPTICTYLDLTSATNILPTAAAVSPFLGTKIQQTYIAKTFSTTYAEYSSNFRMSFVAQSANALVEFQAVIAAYSKIFYGALYDYNAAKFWTTPQTQTRFKYDNGIDQDPTTLYWYLTGLTAGTTYYISPYFRGSASSVFVYAGNSGTANGFAPGIFRVSDGGANVGVY